MYEKYTFFRTSCKGFRNVKVGHIVACLSKGSGFETFFAAESDSLPWPFLPWLPLDVCEAQLKRGPPSRRTAIGLLLV